MMNLKTWMLKQKVGNDKVVKKEGFSIPLWMKEYYEYEGHVEDKINKKVKIVMQCIVQNCKASKQKGAPYWNFIRHLKLVHPKEYENEAQKGRFRTVSRSSKDISPKVLFSTKWQKPTNKGAYKRKDVKQQQFENDLMDLVSIDLLPLDIVARPSFNKLVRNLDKRVRLISRWTLQRRFKNYYDTKFRLKVKRAINKLDDHTLHIILDLWTDRRKSSIIGIKAQFIDSNWKLRNILLGFRAFPKRHTALHIKNIYESVLRETFGVQPNKIGFGHGDNAKNIIKAYKKLPSKNNQEISIDNDVNRANDDDDDDDDDVNWINFEDLFESSDEEEEVEDTDTFQDCINALNQWSNFSTTKIPCFSHLLQLIFSEVLQSNAVSSPLVEKGKKLKAYFHRCTFWYDRLKALAGLGVNEHVVTRWSTAYYVFERLLKPKIQNALDKIFDESRKTDSQCPVSFSQDEYEDMKKIVELLKPLQEATDELQADKVTSSKIIPTIALAYKEIAAVDMTDYPDLKGLQVQLCESTGDRFGPKPLTNRNIVRDSLYTNENLVLASLLDPRIKLLPFKIPFSEPYGFNSSACTPEQAEQILRQMFDKEGTSTPSKDIAQVSPVSDNTSLPTKKKKLSFLDRLEATDSQQQVHVEAVFDEVTKYLQQMPREPSSSNPLLFWQKHERDLPTLSKLAKKFLGFPASSGSVERLFSVSGAIQRTRRAKLSKTTVEYLLCHREMRIHELFGN